MRKSTKPKTLWADTSESIHAHLTDRGNSYATLGAALMMLNQIACSIENLPPTHRKGSRQWIFDTTSKELELVRFEIVERDIVRR